MLWGNGALHKAEYDHVLLRLFLMKVSLLLVMLVDLGTAVVMKAPYFCWHRLIAHNIYVSYNERWTCFQVGSRGGWWVPQAMLIFAVLECFSEDSSYCTEIIVIVIVYFHPSWKNLCRTHHYYMINCSHESSYVSLLYYKHWTC